MKALAVIAATFLLLGSSEASSISAVRIRPSVDSVRVLPDNQYVVCDICPPLTPFTKKVGPQHTPVALKFSSPPVVAHTETAPSHASSSLQRTVTVHFPINSHQLKGGEKIKIRAAQTSLRSAAHVSVTGYTCDLGTQRYNDLLAMRRAKKVAGFLRTLGVPADRLEISGKGRCCYANEVRAGNRRVEITSDSP